MPVTFSNPAALHAPGSRYSHAALVEGSGRRLVMSGQVGTAPASTLLVVAGLADPRFVFEVEAEAID